MTITDAVGRIQQIQSTLTMLSTPAARAQAAPAERVQAAPAPGTTAGTSSTGAAKPATGSSAGLFADALAGATGATGASGAAAGAGSTVVAPAVAPAATPAPVAPAGAVPVPVPASADGARLIEAARSYEGIPYVWGGTDPAVGLDCSGFVQRAYADIGIQIPRVTWDQMNAGTHVPSLAEAQPGDLLFSLEGGHVSMYLGGGKAIDAPQPGKTVAVRDMWETDANITTIRRILPGAPAGAASVAAPAIDAATVAASASPVAPAPTEAPYAAQAAFLASMAR